MYRLVTTVILSTLFRNAITTSGDHTVLYDSDTEVLGNATWLNMITNTNISDVMITVSPSPFILTFMEHRTVAEVNYNISCQSPETSYNLRVYTTDVLVAYLTNPGTYNLSCADNIEKTNWIHPTNNATLVSGSLNITLEADLIGRTWLIFESVSSHTDSGVPISQQSEDSSDTDDDAGHEIHRHLVVVIRIPRPMDQWVQALVYVFVICSTIGMGCNTDLLIVKEVLKKPIAPAIGFVCQYLAMPLIAFGVAKVVTFENPAVALGIFACGTCPGGGPSNIYSYLLGGDLSLSVTMTTISTIAALGMVPLWIFTLGQQFKDDKMQITIPYLSIVQTLATVILPLIAGIVIRYKCKRVASVITKIIKPVTLVTIVVLLSVGIYANLYIFRLFKPATILAGCMLPYIGYVIGGLIALICRQPWYRVKTIAIETGIQNVLVAYLILLMALPPPDGDLAAVGPAASACMTPLPLFVLAIGYTIYLKCTNQTYAQVAMRDKGNVEDTVNGEANTNGKKKTRKSKKRTGNSDKEKSEENGKFELIDKTSSV